MRLLSLVLTYIVSFSNFLSITFSAPAVLSKSKSMPKCGILVARDGRIIGGREAQAGEIPWIASIQISNDNGGTHFCGGSIIGERYILSAAHCFIHLDETAKISVVLGAHNITTTDDTTGAENSELKYERISAKKVISHPEFDGGLQYVNDIAIIELEKQIEWSQWIKPICLPSAGENFGRSEDKTFAAIASGWGRTWGQKEWRKEVVEEEDYVDKYKPHSEVLKTLNLTILPNPECNEFYSKSWNPIILAPSQICAGVSGWDEDTASGDSGGPLSIFQDGRWTIAGVTSFGTPYRAPGVYCRVSSFLDWIHKIMGE